MIHLTAIVDSDAKIGANVEVGPHTLIGGEVTIGENTSIGANAVIESGVIIGHGNRIGHGTIIGSAPQDVRFSERIRSRVEIGNDNLIREYCTIHRGTTHSWQTRRWTQSRRPRARQSSHPHDDGMTSRMWSR